MRMLLLLCSAGLLGSPALAAVPDDAAPPDRVKSEIDALGLEMAEGFGQMYTHRVEVLRRELHLDKKREEKLAAFAEDLGNQVVSVWKTRGLPSNVRLSSLGQLMSGATVLPQPEMPAFTEDAAWQKALATVLTPQELRTANTLAAERQARRLRAGGQELVLILDERMALTRAQREILQPLAERLLKGNRMLADDDTGESDAGGAQIPERVFLAAGAAATDEELRTILNETQLRHWRACCVAAPPETDDDEVDVEEEGEVEVSNAGESPLPRLSEEAELVLSDYFQRKAAAVRVGYLAVLQLRLEELDRVCALSPAGQERLQLAAHGATERALAKWRGPYEREVREQLRPGSHFTLPQQLAAFDRQLAQNQANLADSPAEQREAHAAETEPLWAEALQQARAGLTPAQHAALKTQEEERAIFRTRVLAESVVTDFDHQYLLTSEQFAKLAGLVSGLVKSRGAENPAKHAEVVSNYLQAQCRFIAIFGLPKKAVRETLSDEQWKAWKESEGYTECAETWSSLQQPHQRN